jgi:hypothetical protein
MNVFELGLSIPTPLASCNNQDFQRLETLYSGLKATQAFFDTYLALPVYFARSSSFFTHTQLAKSLGFLHKLSTFESPGWNLDYVRETVDFGNVLDQLIGWFNNVKPAERLEQSFVEDFEDIFSRTVRKLSRIKAWHEQKMASSSLGPEISTTILDADVTINAGGVDFLNDAWA